MKQIFVILTVSLLPGHALVAQDQSEKFVKQEGTVQLGIGRTFTGSGDYYGMMLYTQYNRSLNFKWSVAPRLSFAMGKSGEPLDPTVIGSGVYQQFSAVALDLDFDYKIFPTITPQVAVSLSVGPSLRYLIETGYTSVNKQINQTTGEVILDADYRQSDGFTIGATGGINLTVGVTDNFMVIGRASAQLYSDGEAVPFYGIALGRRF